MPCGDCCYCLDPKSKPCTCRRALEVLIRKLLTLPNSPALVYLHWWSPTTNQVR